MIRNYFSDIRLLANASPTEEICGFLLHDGKGSLEVLQATNIVPPSEREGYWMISSQEQLAAYKTNRVKAVYHSHVGNRTAKPTEEDILTAETSHLPQLVYSVSTNSFDYYRPKCSILPYEGRPFILGIQDCGALVADYYTLELGKETLFSERDPHSLEAGLEILPRLGNDFVRVYSVEKGDILAISLASNNRSNHVAVYTGEGRMLHQMLGRESSYAPYSETWRDRTTAIYRLRSRM